MVLRERAVDAERLRVRALRRVVRLPPGRLDPLVPVCQPLQQHPLPRLVPRGAVHRRPARRHGQQHHPEPDRHHRPPRSAQRRTPGDPGPVDGGGHQHQQIPDEHALGHPVRIGGQRRPHQRPGGGPAHHRPPPAPHQGVPEPEPAQIEQRRPGRPQSGPVRRRPHGRRTGRRRRRPEPGVPASRTGRPARRRHAPTEPGSPPRSRAPITGLHTVPPPPSRKVTGNLPVSTARHARSRRPLRTSAHHCPRPPPTLPNAATGACPGRGAPWNRPRGSGAPRARPGRHLRRAVRLGIRVHAAPRGRPGRRLP